MSQCIGQRSTDDKLRRCYIARYGAETPAVWETLVGGPRAGIQSQTQISFLLLLSCVALDRWFNLSDPQFAHLLNGDCNNNNNYLTGILKRNKGLKILQLLCIIYYFCARYLTFVGLIPICLLAPWVCCFFFYTCKICKKKELDSL